MAGNMPTDDDFENELNAEIVMDDDEDGVEGDVDDAVDEEGVDEEGMDGEEDDEDENEDEPTLDSLDPDDPIEGPIRQFLTELLANASVPVDALQIGLYLSVVTEDMVENLKEGEEIDPDLEELATINLTVPQRLGILEANAQQLLSTLQTSSIDRDVVDSIRESLEDEDGFVDFSGDDVDLDELDGDAVSYIDYIQQIVPGVKVLFKSDPDGVVDILAKIVQYAVQHDNHGLYEDIAKCGGKIMKKVMWKVLHR